MVNENINFETLKALNASIKGLVTKEVITEYQLDEESGDLKVVKQKIAEKHLPPNVDLLKLVYPDFVSSKRDYEKLTDDELEKEKVRLLKLLKESCDESGKNQNKS